MVPLSGESLYSLFDALAEYQAQLKPFADEILAESALFVYDGDTAQQSDEVFILSNWVEGDYGITYASKEDEGDNEDPSGSGGLPNNPRGKAGGGYGTAASISNMARDAITETPIALDLNASGSINILSTNIASNKAFFDDNNINTNTTNDNFIIDKGKKLIKLVA